MLGKRNKKTIGGKDGFLYPDKAIISIKEARKLIGKEASDNLSDVDLMKLVGMMNKIADTLLSEEFVPNNIMAYNSNNE